MNFNKLTAYLESIGGQYGIPYLDCAVTYHHDMVFRHMTGHYDREKKKPTNISVLYRMFSATKMITCVAAMQLVEQGKLDLYGLLKTYLPEFSLMRVATNFDFGKVPVNWPKEDTKTHLANHPIRVIDLITMTAGFSYDTMAQSILELKRQTSGTGSTRRTMAALAKMPLMFEPGTHWAYSLAHDVLAAVIEAVSGQSFSEYLRKHVFSPLETDDFYFTPTPEIAGRLGHLYNKDRLTGLTVEDDGVYSGSFQLCQGYESGGAGLITTVDAYSKVIDGLSCGGTAFNGFQLLKPETAALFTIPYTWGATQEDFTLFCRGRKDYGYGLGVRVRVTTGSGRPPLGEFGWDGAAGAYFAVDMEHQLSIVYAQHVMGCIDAFDVIHPTIRNLVYEAMEF